MFLAGDLRLGCGSKYSWEGLGAELVQESCCTVSFLARRFRTTSVLQFLLHERALPPESLRKKTEKTRDSCSFPQKPRSRLDQSSWPSRKKSPNKQLGKSRVRLRLLLTLSLSETYRSDSSVVSDVKDKEQGREKHDEKSPDEASERPVRRKLQETRITSDSFKEGAIGNDLSHSSDDSGSERGRLRKKRSIDELNSDNAPSTHRRKRSRGSEDDDGGGGDGDVKAPRETTPERSAQADRGTQNLLSPKKKRSLDQLEKESPGNGDVKSAAGGGDRLHAVGERETKRYRDASQERRREDNAGINAKVCLLLNPDKSRIAAEEEMSP